MCWCTTSLKNKKKIIGFEKNSRVISEKAFNIKIKKIFKSI